MGVVFVQAVSGLSRAHSPRHDSFVLAELSNVSSSDETYRPCGEELRRVSYVVPLPSLDGSP